jgi:hypothetical protein
MKKILLLTFAITLFACSDNDETTSCNCTQTTTSDGEVISTTDITLESIPGAACSAGNSTVNSTVGDITVTIKTVCN